MFMATTVGEARFLIELAKLMVDPQAVSDRLGKATLTKIWRAPVKKDRGGEGVGGQSRSLFEVRPALPLSRLCCKSRCAARQLNFIR